MGFLSANDDSRASDLAEQEINRNAMELEEKKHNLYQTRLDIIKSQGSQNWTPDYNKGVGGGGDIGNSLGGMLGDKGDKGGKGFF